HGDRGEIGGLVVADVFDAIVVEYAFDVGRCQSRQHAELEGFHPTLVRVEAVLQPADRRLDERDFHASRTGVMRAPEALALRARLRAAVTGAPEALALGARLRAGRWGRAASARPAAGPACGGSRGAARRWTPGRAR